MKGSLIGYMSNMVKTQGGINLAQGIPAFSPPAELLSLLSEFATNPNFHQYAPGKGNVQLLDLLSEHYNKPKDDFLIVNGATESISTIFTYLTRKHPNCSVLAFDPIYESYKHLSRIFNNDFFTVDASAEICFDEIRQTIEQHNVKIIFLAIPGNPLGKIWTEQQIKTLMQIADDYGAYLIIDAVYSDLYFYEKPYYPIHEMGKNVFYVNAFSKKLSITGWRLGYILSSKEHMEGLMDIHDYIGLSSPTVLQEALAKYLQEYDFGKEYCASLRQKLKANYELMQEQLSNLGFEVVQAQGGYFIWCKLPQKFQCGLDFALELYKQTKVAVVPGIHFSDSGKQMIRINIARSDEEIAEAIGKITEFLRN